MKNKNARRKKYYLIERGWMVIKVWPKILSSIASYKEVLNIH